MKLNINISKSEKILYEIFYEERKKYPINKIKISDLCKLANINRSTFYDHFIDIYDLTNKLEKLLVNISLKNFNKQKIIYTNPSIFLEELSKCLIAYRDEFNILGRGREKELLLNIETEIDRLFKDEIGGEDKEFIITYIIGGSCHVLEKYANSNKGYKIDEINSQLKLLSESILSMYNNYKGK